jgi:hypothetical protein
MSAFRVIAGLSALALYLIVAGWLKAGDPDLLLPNVSGEIVSLHKPFLQHGNRAAAPDYWFGQVADSSADLCRSPVMIYENAQPLGPMHSTDAQIVIAGNGRSLHWRTDEQPQLYAARSVFYFSASDNTNPTTNGRRYWAVKPKLDAITCPDDGKYIPPPYSGLKTAPRAVVRLRNFEVSPNNHMILSGDIEEYSELGDSPEDENRSPALLFEDGRLLGPARATDIATKGLGGYSHRKSHGMVFSTSDNSDPRTNGRHYYVVFP